MLLSLYEEIQSRASSSSLQVRLCSRTICFWYEFSRLERSPKQAVARRCIKTLACEVEAEDLREEEVFWFL